ncbi:MAG TPA: hypothetical protein PLX89_18110 [Verrucomicrobiota bacterium]|nr:hypothetical protein [Verrucomicrobiota bacterium]
MAIVSLATAGCCTSQRCQLENVAKDWCETIRASQVIPVYPLTQDLVVGDVFLVQTPIQAQAHEYERRGFLALDDFRVRLPYTNYSSIYFNGYWQDEFGDTPHPVPQVTGTNWNRAAGLALLNVEAPRAAFPTYSFAAQSGGGLSAAFPVQGIPVALGYLGSASASGTVTIADAYTVGGDPTVLLHQLRHWANQPVIAAVLDETVKTAAPTPIYLRVVSRVYLTRAIDVALQSARSFGGSAQAGTGGAVPLVTNGVVNTNYLSLLNALNGMMDQATPSIPGGGTANISSPIKAGGAVKFVSAGESSVGLQQAFDRPLVIGYLGFDVPVYEGGDLGAPIPTFLRLTRKVDEPVVGRAGQLNIDQAQFVANEAALRDVAGRNPAQAVRVMKGIVAGLDTEEFSGVGATLKALPTPPGGDQLKTCVSDFTSASEQYVRGKPMRYGRFNDAFADAFADSLKPARPPD